MAKSKRKIVSYTWQELEVDIEMLAQSIKEQYQIKNVYGVERGGLVSAVMLSHRLEIPLITKDRIDSRTLIVDDIIETGFTIASLARQLKGVKPIVVSLFVTEKTERIPDLYRRIKNKNEWMIFPWESKIKVLQDSKKYYGKRKNN